MHALCSCSLFSCAAKRASVGNNRKLCFFFRCVDYVCIYERRRNAGARRYSQSCVRVPAERKATWGGACEGSGGVLRGVVLALLAIGDDVGCSGHARVV